MHQDKLQEKLGKTKEHRGKLWWFGLWSLGFGVWSLEFGKRFEMHLDKLLGKAEEKLW